MNDATLAVLRAAREVVLDGGDTSPCELGAYCLRCCVAIAKSAVDARLGIGFCRGDKVVDAKRVAPETGLALFDQMYESDLPLIEARDLIAKYDPGIVHTRESALALLDQVIGENS